MKTSSKKITELKKQVASLETSRNYWEEKYELLEASFEKLTEIKEASDSEMYNEFRGSVNRNIDEIGFLRDLLTKTVLTNEKLETIKKTEFPDINGRMSEIGMKPNRY